MTAPVKVAPSGSAVALVQPDREHPPEVQRGAPAAKRFHASMPGYRPTVLRNSPVAASRLGVGEVLVKDESKRLGLPSFKVLGASYAVYRAILDRLGADGRAVARMAALLELGSDIYVPANTACARIEAIESEGATVTVIDGGYDDAVARSAKDAGDSCLVWVQDQWAGPVGLKGVLRAEDAVQAARMGIAGVIVSNHGGRQLDQAPSTISVLPAIADAAGSELEVYMDGGIRRGVDIVKAVALGARLPERPRAGLRAGRRRGGGGAAGDEHPRR